MSKLNRQAARERSIPHKCLTHDKEECGSCLKVAATEIISEKDALIQSMRDVCGEAYQLAGAIGAPVAVLDNLSDAASGGPLRHETFLPILDTDCFEIQDRDATIAVKNALIASQAAEITKLELCLEPGKASAIVRAVFDIAEKKCGHNPFSARHGLATIDEYLDRQAGLIQNMREALEKAPHIDGCRSALVLCANCGEVKPMHDGTMRYCRGRDDAAQWEPKARECDCWKSRALAQVSASQEPERDLVAAYHETFGTDMGASPKEEQP